MEKFDLYKRYAKIRTISASKRFSATIYEVIGLGALQQVITGRELLTSNKLHLQSRLLMMSFVMSGVTSRGMGVSEAKRVVYSVEWKELILSVLARDYTLLMENGIDEAINRETGFPLFLYILSWTLYGYEKSNRRYVNDIHDRPIN